MSDVTFFCIVLGGAILITLFSGWRISRKFPRIPERHGVKISRATGGAYADIGEVVESELERIRAGEACPSKTHWRKP